MSSMSPHAPEDSEMDMKPVVDNGTSSMNGIMGSSYPKERRFKLSRACDRCRRRRIRCDEGHPCQSCLSANSACTFEEPGKRTHPHKSKRSATLEDRMHHLESLIQSIPSAMFANTATPTPTTAPTTTTTTTTKPVLPSSISYPSGVPPPSLNTYPLMNPAPHFPLPSYYYPSSIYGYAYPPPPPMIQQTDALTRLADTTARLSIAPSYLYFDDEGSTRWQGETSGLPLLDLLVERGEEEGVGVGVSPANGNGATTTTTTQEIPYPRMHPLRPHQSTVKIKTEPGTLPDPVPSSSSNPPHSHSHSNPTSTSTSTTHIHNPPNGSSAPDEFNPNPTYTNGNVDTNMGGPTTETWFPDRMPRKIDPNPETLWKLITSRITPDLMDTLVQCFLSTTHYLLPFLHVPTFLLDYGTPSKWGEPGFASFILSICALSSRHIDDPRVRADPSDSLSAGLAYFELMAFVRGVQGGERPTVYLIQAQLLAAVYAVGMGRLTRGLALLAEAITLSIDAGIHRSVDVYDLFDPIEDQVRKRTFFCVYIWDKQAAAAFGRPPMLRLRDTDVPEPAPIDDEYITHSSLGPQPPNKKSVQESFIHTIRLYTLLEAVLDTPPTHDPGAQSSFRTRVAGVLSGFDRHWDLRAEERLLDLVVGEMDGYWRLGVGVGGGGGGPEPAGPETTEPDSNPDMDVIRITQSRRIYCLELFIRMLIHRRRFAEFVGVRRDGSSSGGGGGVGAGAGAGSGSGITGTSVAPSTPSTTSLTNGLSLQIGGGGGGGSQDPHSQTHSQTQTQTQLQPPPTDWERESMMACHACAVRIVESHMHMANSSLMTYFGVHVIHQLTQASRTLIAILLNCKTEDLKPLVPASLEALRSCVVLLRRFSGRYVCGLRNGELVEEFCRLTRIPLDAPQTPADPSRPAWLRPVPKKHSNSFSVSNPSLNLNSNSNDSRESSDTSSPGPVSSGAPAPGGTNAHHTKSAGGVGTGATVDIPLFPTTASPSSSFVQTPLTPDEAFSSFGMNVGVGMNSGMNQGLGPGLGLGLGLVASPTSAPEHISYMDSSSPHTNSPSNSGMAETTISPAEFMAFFTEGGHGGGGPFDMGNMLFPSSLHPQSHSSVHSHVHSHSHVQPPPQQQQQHHQHPLHPSHLSHSHQQHAHQHQHQHPHHSLSPTNPGFMNTGNLNGGQNGNGIGILSP